MNWKNCLYLIVDFSYGEDRIIEALKNGVDVVQLREKDISSKEYLKRAKRMRELTRLYPTIFIVDDRLDIAMLAEADGVHLGQSDIPVDEARKVLGPDKIIGATAKTVEQAAEAKEKGADYLGSGAWYTTSTKPDAIPMTPEQYLAIVRSCDLPNVAIGGITPENCDRPLACEATGLAVASGIMKGNIAENIRRFREKLKYREEMA